jgi:hypothetical protein
MAPTPAHRQDHCYLPNYKRCSSNPEQIAAGIGYSHTQADGQTFKFAHPGDPERRGTMDMIHGGGAGIHMSPSIACIALALLVTSEDCR